MKEKKFKLDTLAIHEGRAPREQRSIVNVPVYRSSTVLFSTLEELEASNHETPFPGQLNYGRQGLPTTFALEEAVTSLEGGFSSLTVASGLAAITTTLLAFVSRGDHLLVADSVYGPTRRFCDRMLGRMGVETTYYDPMIGAGIEKLVRPNTRCIFLESPGSLTFEVQDVPAIAKIARQHGVVTLLDNTWATPL
ncbi:MAG: PLP-dependent transferase, partial [Pseudomonadota bacterium]|nr:PLP-dependent transferase [Pseudomonadota bacterium]